MATKVRGSGVSDDKADLKRAMLDKLAAKKKAESAAAAEHEDEGGEEGDDGNGRRVQSMKTQVGSRLFSSVSLFGTDTSC